MSEQDMLTALKGGATIVDAANDAPRLSSGEAVPAAFFLSLRLTRAIRAVQRGDPVIWRYMAVDAPPEQERLWQGTS